MRDGSVTSGTAIIFWAHGGTREPAETIAPSYEAERQSQALAVSFNPELAPWVAHERFAPPGPGLTYLPTLRLVLPLFGAIGSYPAAPPELPEALLDEPAVFQHLADVAEEEQPGPSSATEFDEPDDLADHPPLDEGLAPYDWLPHEPPTPTLEASPPDHWETGPDPAIHADAAEPVEPVGIPPPLAEDLAPAAPPPPEGQSKVLSWLDKRLRLRREAELGGFAEPEPVPFHAPAVAPIESAVEDAPRESQAKRQAPVDDPVAEAPHGSQIAPPEPMAVPLVVEPLPEAVVEPPPLAPEPPPLPIAAQLPVVVDMRRSRRIEPRLPKGSHLPSLFTRAPESPRVAKVGDAARPRKFGWRMLGRRSAPPIGIPAMPAAGPETAGIATSRPFQPPEPAPLEPAPQLDIPPPPAEVTAPRREPLDLPVQIAPEPAPSPAVPAYDFPPLPAEVVPPDIYVAPSPQDVPASRPAAYWAEANWAKPTETTQDQPESLAWTPHPATLPGVTGARRTTPAMDGLWATEPVGASDAGPVSQDGSGRRTVRRAATAGAGIVILAAAAGAIFHFLPKAFVSNLVPAATFNAPMMVLRANAPGRVASVAVQNGQTVDPDTLLLTIRTEPQPDPAAALLRARLEAAQARLSDLDQSLAQATPITDAGRARIAELRRQRALAVIDVAQLQDGVTNIPAAKASDLPVKAGVHGVIRSLEARAGAITAIGLPLVRMLDCDHAFLTVGPDSKLRAGQAVQVRLPNLPPVAATVRQSAGIAEPPESLVIATQPGAFVGQLSGSCPIGATATVTPSMTGS